MGLFDNFHMPDLSDPETAARLRGALMGAAQGLGVPGGNLGTAAVGAGQGGQAGIQQYQQQQANQFGIANDKFGLQQKLGSVNFLRNLRGQNPLTIDDVMKGNFGQSGAAPMGVPQAPQQPIQAPAPVPQTAAQIGPRPVQAQIPMPQAAPTQMAANQTPEQPSQASSLIPPDLASNPIFQAAIQFSDAATVMSMMTKHQVQLTSEELKAANLPADSLAFKNPSDGTIDIKRTGTIQSPEELAASVAADQAKGLKSQAELDQEFKQKQREAGIQPPSVENQILLPLMRKVMAGQTLTPQETAALTMAKPTYLMQQGIQPTDDKSTSLLAQTGLSQAALDWLTKGARPRGQQQYNAIQQEITDYSRKTGVDTATLQAQAQAFNNILTNNIQRNNQGQILENEIQGSVANVAPLADAIKQGKISPLNLANVWAGKTVNDPTTLKFKDQLLRLQHELAGYNAVAGGKLTENGTARIDQSDLDSAADVITKGINAGGLRGLSDSIGLSTTKNRAVLGSAIDDANQGMWNLFKVGKNYQRQYPSVGGSGGPSPNIYPTPPPAAITALKLKKDKSQFDEIFGPGAADRALNGK